MGTLLKQSGIILLTVVGFWLAACRGGNGAGPPVPAPGDILRSSAEALDRANSFHFLLEHENGTTPIFFDLQMDRAEGDILRPDRMQAEVTARLRGVTARSKVIAIGDQAWMTNPFTQGFQPLPTGTSVRQLFDPGTGVRRIVEAMQDPRLTENERIDGVDCYVIEGRMDSADLRAVAPIAESGLTVKVRVHVGKDDRLPRRVRLDGPLAQSEQPTIARKVSLSRFNEQMSIEPPQ